MKDSARYAKIVAWSNEDGCYVGSCPGLLLGGCHGDDEREVFAQLCVIVEETIDLYRADGRPLPPATAGGDLVNRLQDVALIDTGTRVGRVANAAIEQQGRLLDLFDSLDWDPTFDCKAERSRG